MKYLYLLIIYVSFCVFGISSVYADNYIDPYQELGMKSKKLTKTEQPVLVICISYPDSNFTTSRSAVYNKFFRPQVKSSTTASIRSLSAYYSTMSQGRIKFLPASENFGQPNDGIVSIKINVDCTGLDGRIIDIEQETSVVKAVFDELNDLGLDFSKYDENDDKILQREELHLALCFAGKASDTGLWEYYLPKNIIDKNGIKLGTKNEKGFVILSEDTSIETICHEFGHSLGLPDLYNANIGQTLDSYSLMDNSSKLTYLDAWCRLVLDSNNYNSSTYTTIYESGVYSLYSLKSGKNNILRINTDKGYYLIENRDGTGYDKASLDVDDIDGIVIYRIDNEVLLKTLPEWRTSIGTDIGIGTLINNNPKSLKLGKSGQRASYIDTDTGIRFEALSKSSDIMKLSITFPK